MNISKLKILSLMALMLLVSGCTLFPSTTPKKPIVQADGGIWRSIDAGKIFAQSGDVLSVKGKIANLNNLNVLKLAFDPSDANTVYAGTDLNGLFYSMDGGSSWSQFKTLTQGYIQDIAVDPANKCIIYVLTGNKIFKTENCGRDFNNIYYHQKANIALTAFAIDPKSPMTVYVGTSEGEVLKSTDGGHAWLAVMRESREKVMDVIVDSNDSKIIYVGTARSGIFKSIDAGKSWGDLGTGLTSYVGTHEYKKLIADPATPNGLIFISKFGLLRTSDGGNSWQVIELLPDHKNTTIVAVAVNPKNSAEFYYATASSLVKTSDGGVKWSSKKMPFSNRLATGIFVNPGNQSVVYLTTQLVKK